MASYIESTLENNEKIVYKDRLHWTYNWKYSVSGIVLALCGVIGMIYIAATNYNDFNNNMLALFTLCAVATIAGLILVYVSYFLRGKVEFAITTLRFILKEGIFNIDTKNTPLAKIENVEVQQAFIERFINRGTIKITGSGSTEIKIDSVPNPHKLQRVLMANIKDNKTTL